LALTAAASATGANGGLSVGEFGTDTVPVCLVQAQPLVVQLAEQRAADDPDAETDRE